MGKLLALSLTAATAMSSAAIPAFAGTASNSAVSTYAADETDDSYTYVYAGLTWNEYWASEGVYAAGNDSSSDILDSHSETDKGGFDVVTRATTNHGLHRGSFQCSTAIEDTDGNTHTLSHWTSETVTSKDDNGADVNTTIVKAVIDGKSYTTSTQKDADNPKKTWLTFTSEDGATVFTMEDYKVTGIKYVPVAVKTADLEAFKAKYNVVENGGILIGGYSENNLKSYSETANVTANTNGLKVASKNEDDTFSFSARKNNGTDSGITEKSLKTASGATPVVKDASGSYGEFLRVDINGDYGDLGANMQAVQWTYYGSDSTYSKPLATYGTKFAADNWMHKSMGIQLGLTNSVRCQLPQDTDGTGYWRLTVYALGYEDYTYDFQATEANIVKDTDEEINTSDLEAAIAKADALNEADYTADSWASLKAELDESKELLDNAKAGKAKQSEVVEQTGHLNDAIAHLVAVKHITAVTLNKISATLIAGKTLTLKATVTPADTADDTTVTYKSSNSAVASVDAKGNVTAKSAGTATITATAGNKSATCKVTVVNKAGKATLSKTAFTYNKKVQKPSVTVKDSKGNKISSANYTVKYANSKNPGRYAVTVSFQGVYAGTASQTLYYDIKPAATSVKLSKATKNSITAKWGASAGVTGYEIQYSTASNFKKAVKTVKVSSKTTRKKLTKLTKNKKYFVRVRAYKSVTVNKKKVTLNASWSAVKNLKTKKK